MPSYPAEFDRLLEAKQQHLQRKLFPEETAALAVGLVETWFEQGRTADLTRYVLKEFSREGGLQEISMLARLLCRQGDADGVKSLFGALAQRRIKAYREWLAKAQTGHIGSMRSAGHALAQAMDIQAESCVWLEKLGQVQACEEVRAEMLRLLATVPHAKPATRPARPASTGGPEQASSR
jgi:hypothetical protein